MSLPTLHPLLDSSSALAHPVTRLCLWLVAAALILAPVVLLALQAMGRLSPQNKSEAWARYRGWLWVVPVIVAPVLWCRLGAMLLVVGVTLLAYREFARATGLFRHRGLSALVVLFIAMMGLAALDHWYAMFLAIPPLGMAMLAGFAVLSDQPSGYLQRVALASVALSLLGAGLMHLAYFANALDYRPILCMLLLCTQGGDIAAYGFGKAFGRRKLFPNTSPEITLGGHLGAFFVTTALAAVLGRMVFEDTMIAQWPRLLGLSLLIAVGAQLGDLVLSSIKRDLGMKDLAQVLPGHGGVSDRVNSLMLVAPVVFHYVLWCVGVGLERPARIFTGP